MATIEDLNKIISMVLLSLLSPFLALSCIIVFLYERVILNDQECTEYRSRISRLYVRVVSGANLIVTFPLTLLGLGPYIPFSTLFFWMPVMGICVAFRAWVSDPLFLRFVPSLYDFWNSQTYRPLEEDTGPTSPNSNSRRIRVVQILPGALAHEMKVNISPVDWDTGTYDVLSYTWGSHLILRRVITVNDRPFLVTDSLFRALRQLRHTKETRSVWIDALCINQYDNHEKERQVAMMRHIFNNAKRVHIWLGEAPIQLASTFDFVRRLAAAEPNQIDTICAQVSDTWREPLQEILHRKWWSRVWIVEEVALARDIVIRSGQHELPWETLSRFLQRSEQIAGLDVDRKILDFIYTLAEFKGPYIDPKQGLLDLALRFRHRVAVKPRDKLFGFRGLLTSKDSPTIETNYRKATWEIFVDFAASNIIRMGDLSVMTLAESRWTGSSWAVNWEEMTAQDWMEYNPFFSDLASPEIPNMFWNGQLLDSDIAVIRKYNAAGGLRSSCKLRPRGWDTLLVEGWEVDTVATVGPHFHDEAPFQHIMEQCIKLAGGPWTDPVEEKGLAFSRTMIGDAWREDLPSDWPYLYNRQRSPGDHTAAGDGSNTQSLDHRVLNAVSDVEHGAPLSDADKRNAQMFQLMALCCARRHFFITKQGSFGLGPSQTRSRQLVCVLLGSDVPLLLQRFGDNEFRFIGQAYVDGIMDYKGDLRQDIESGKVKTREFILC